MAESVKFRADHVGSLLRPPPLLAARRHDAGEITDDELRAAEDEAIVAVVRMQEEAGIDVVTDAEFRRRDFRTGFVDTVAASPRGPGTCRGTRAKARAEGATVITGGDRPAGASLEYGC